MYFVNIKNFFRVFGTSSAMLFHNTNDHVKKDCAAAGDRPIFCKWPACDVIPRSKWSMVSHLQVVEIILKKHA